MLETSVSVDVSVETWSGGTYDGFFVVSAVSHTPAAKTTSRELFPNKGMSVFVLKCP